jgi:hypothetical protein
MATSRLQRRAPFLEDLHCTVIVKGSCPACGDVQDVAEAEGQVSPALLQRLILKPQKIQQLADGIRAIAAQEEPIRRVLQRTEVADGKQGNTAGWPAKGLGCCRGWSIRVTPLLWRAYTVAAMHQLHGSAQGIRTHLKLPASVLTAVLCVLLQG